MPPIVKFRKLLKPLYLSQFVVYLAPWVNSHGCDCAGLLIGVIRNVLPFDATGPKLFSAQWGHTNLQLPRTLAFNQNERPVLKLLREFD